MITTLIHIQLYEVVFFQKYYCYNRLKMQDAGKWNFFSSQTNILKPYIPHIIFNS